MDFDLRALPVTSAPLLYDPVSLSHRHHGEITSPDGSM